MTAKDCTKEQAAAILLDRVQAYAVSPRGKDSDPNKIPLPTTWLNEGRYDDSPQAWSMPLTNRPVLPLDRAAKIPEGAVFNPETGGFEVPLDT